MCRDVQGRDVQGRGGAWAQTVALRPQRLPGAVLEIAVLLEGSEIEAFTMEPDDARDVLAAALLRSCDPDR